MKILHVFLLSTITLLFISCQGEDGRDGRDGLDGVNILGSVFEAEVDFNSGNDFEVLIDFPNQIEVFDTDVVVAYILVDVVNGIDVWEPLPQTLFFEDGILLYGFNYTSGDINFFLDGTVDLQNLLPELTQDIIFRVAILPADDAQALDLSNFESVVNSLRQKDIIRLN